MARRDRREKYVTAAALLAVLTGTYSVSYAVAQGRAAYGIEVYSVEAPPLEPNADETDEADEADEADGPDEVDGPNEVDEVAEVGEIGRATRRPAR
ncbi:hypothetical protein ACH40E_07280 [Streptomyces acidicola]|uniref:hypothetical protein n=1 Tax=Streptomyces acidicola TaxID=2596892 RepID=UPI00379CB32F